MKTKYKIDRKIEIKSSTANLSLVRDFVKKAAKDSGFNDETIGKIILAVDEACTNVIKHAYHYSNDGDIKIRAVFDKSKFKVIITDHGEPFNAKEIPEPNLQEYHRLKKVGGLGMFLMRKLMDEINYSTGNKTFNKVTLVKYLK